MLLLFEFCKIYWKSLVTFIWPLMILPILVLNNSPAFRCIYVVLIMCVYWITECIPPPLTSLLPMVLFPLMGILSSDRVAANYMNDTNMMLIGSIVIAIAMEETKLHMRIALNIINVVGCSIKRLHIGLCLVTMFISMWIANTAATALMLPVVEGTLQALQLQGLISMWEIDEQLPSPSPKPAGTATAPTELSEDRRPSNITMCYYISIAYASLIGGTGCIIGSGANLAYKGLYETRFPHSPGVEFAKWMMLNLPLMLITILFSILWIQIWYLGLFRPYSKAAKDINLGADSESAAKEIISTQLNQLGPIRFEEIVVAFCFVLAVILWFFRRPGFIPGWPHLFTELKVGDAVVAIFILFLFILMPNFPDFIYLRSSDEAKRPTSNSPSIVSWKVIERKMHWGLLFVLGGGFAMAEGAKTSGMTKLIAESLKSFLENDKIIVMIVCCGMAVIITQFLSSNVACVTIVTPVVLDMSVVAGLHPMYLGMSVALASCYSFLLPVSTPPNALIAGPSRIKGIEMAKVGLGQLILTLAVLLIVYPFYAPLVWDMDILPDWVETDKEEKP
ncbi:protein I'm not dead yet-like [Diorhabda carinulata]|uniref:protein I'm not dead yet-like n=1 Tax=Diorhabda carinulata TaxID=1163345 RepID=UPI0025A079CF|nr:protein I'm not dead yet-like [Diorhabda carinulata]